MRALASHQCGPSSIPDLGVIRGLSLLLVLVPAPRVFSGYSGFPPSAKTNIFKFQFDLETVDFTVIPHLFYFILFYFILFYFILFYFILFYLFYFILFYFILFYFILFY